MIKPKYLNALLTTIALSTTGCISSGFPPGDFSSQVWVSIGGSITGLEPGEEVLLELYNRNSSADNLRETQTYTANGSYSFETQLSSYRTYAGNVYPYYEVVVKNHPDGKFCTVDRRREKIAKADIDHVTVNCGTAQIPDLLVNFSDSAFAYCINQMAYEDGYTMMDEVLRLDCARKGITDPTGIELLPSLVYLDIEGNSIGSLDLSQQVELNTLNANDNGLISLNVSSSTKLDTVRAADNVLTTIDFSNNLLIDEIDLSNNSLTSINLTGLAGLAKLLLNNNNLEVIDTSDLETLNRIELSDNQITTIDLSNVRFEIYEVELWRNPLTQETIDDLELLKAAGYIDRLWY